VRIGLEIGLRMLPGTDHASFSVSRLIEQVRQADRAGFSSVWISDSLGRGAMTLDPLAVLTVAAGAAASLEVGTAVYQVPLREPVELAQRVLSAFALSGGRLRFGVGAGSSRTDFAAVGRSFEDRFAVLHASVREMRGLWRGEARNGVSLHPTETALGGPPVLLGSWGKPEAVERAARELDGWIASAWPLSRNASEPSSQTRGAGDIRARLQRAMAIFRGSGGRRAIIANVPVAFGEKPAEFANGLGAFGTAAEIETGLRQLEELGFDDAVLRLRGGAELRAVGEIWHRRA
jgi:alkanesulfonate monooxygenase SsuD/methylene tetrahydromethanopterin reductase-like flavin-dependent oxidoreductase (luciferase family)